MKTNWFHILLCLAGGEQHGYGIMQEVLERTSGQIRLWPATLYGALRRLVEEGLIEECGDRAGAAPGENRRRYYRLSAEGRDRLSAEIRRLDQLVKAARSKRRLLGMEAAS